MKNFYVATILHYLATESADHTISRGTVA